MLKHTVTLYNQIVGLVAALPFAGTAETQKGKLRCGFNGFLISSWPYSGAERPNPSVDDAEVH